MKTPNHIAAAQLGYGIYTMPDISRLLNIDQRKIRRRLSSFWGQKVKGQYFWEAGPTKAVNFYTLIEIYTFFQLTEAGVPSGKILTAHNLLSERYNTPYPFANRTVIKQLRTEGSGVFFEEVDGSVYNMSTLQYHLNFIKLFFKNLEFGESDLAIKLYPLAESKLIVCDPHHQFGQPVISGTNILADTIYSMNLGGDSVDFISKTYNISRKKIQDAIAYARQAA